MTISWSYPLNEAERPDNLQYEIQITVKGSDEIWHLYDKHVLSLRFKSLSDEYYAPVPRHPP